ncbi:MAG: hypothetical protein HKO95_07565 [Rhodobacteraceae bacterium]|jgi:hypothetical protein|nr:hypothetical protein [Alphaproteobacteria bacterium]MBT8475935.1 hypothetical protein [Alphaproteobacteria bacterium]NNK66578.1 hypothetical protein [Paracoccaceae bacterium]
MTGRIIAGLITATALLAGTAAFSQESSNRVAAKTDWSVFVETDPTECWSVSAPKETVNTRDGRVVAVRRGDILLFVTHRPGSDVSGEVSFTGGYPFANGSTVTLEIGDETFELFTEGEWAWPASPSDDTRITNAMKRGTLAIATARSARGTVTKDTFSLLGFTAAVDEAESRCSN